jgi:hypothetical protein
MCSNLNLREQIQRKRRQTRKVIALSFRIQDGQAIYSELRGVEQIPHVFCILLNDAVSMSHEAHAASTGWTILNDESEIMRKEAAVV